MPSTVPSGGSGRGDFPTTQWSLVLAAGDRELAGGNHALAELCRAYWRPLYAYVRRRGHREEEAKDLTQDFFVMLLERDVIARVDRERGRFRTFLLAALRNFLADQHDRNTAKKRGGGAAHISFEEHGGDELDLGALPPSATAELCFDTEWARTLAQRALDQVCDAYAARGRGETFAALRGFLTGDDSTNYAAAGKRIGMTEAAATSAIHRLRRDYRTSLRTLVAQTVRDLSDLDDELHYLFGVLSRPQG